MFPKTLAPYGARRLSDLLQAGGAIPLWRAGTILIQLLALDGNCPWPLDPESVFLDAGNQVSIHPSGDSHPDAVYQAPECRLSMCNDARPSAQVYGLCALLYHMIVGTLPPAEEPLAIRRAKLQEAIEGMPLPGDAGKTLRKTLDRGLRLEPTRRQQTTEELKQELEGLAAYLDTEALQTLQIRGISGVYAGRKLPLRFPMTLGRQPGDCQILFPPGTPGVSRCHCRLDLCWGSVLVTDLNSSYGSFFDETRLYPLAPLKWECGQNLSLGSRQQRFVLCENEGNFHP